VGIEFFCRFLVTFLAAAEAHAPTSDAAGQSVKRAFQPNRSDSIELLMSFPSFPFTMDSWSIKPWWQHYQGIS
jgi:hypothetical protein